MDLIGKMYHTLEVLSNTPTALGAGSQDDYDVLVTTRCALDESNGSRGNVLGIIQGGNSAMVITRYQDAIWNNTRMSSKLRIDNVLYTVQGWKRKEDKRRQYIEFEVSKNTN